MKEPSKNHSHNTAIDANAFSMDNIALQRMLIDKANDMLFVHMPNPDLTDTMLDFNEIACQTLGYTREELLNISPRNLVVPEEEPLTKSQTKELEQNGQILFEKTLIKKDGTRFPVEIHSHLFEHNQRKLIVSVIRDITKRKLTEDKLKKSAIIIDSTSDAVITTDLKGVITSWNKGAQCIYGYNENEILGKHVSILYRKEDLNVLEAMIEKLLEWKEIPNVELTCIDKNGYEVHILLSLTTIKDKNENVIELVGLTKDITEFKRTEIALRQEKENAQKYLDIAGVMFVAINEKGNITLINRKGQEILGYEQNEIVGKNWFEHFLPNNIREKVRTVFNRLVAGEIEPVEYFENPILTKQGEERIIAWHNTLLKNEMGATVGTLSSGEDITERKKAEHALLESEWQSRWIFDHSLDGIVSVDLQGRFLNCNQAYLDMLGYTLDELREKTYFELTPEKWYEKEKQIVTEKVMKEGRSGLYEKEYIRKDGTVFPVEINAYLVRDQENNPVGMWGIARDITERKQTEKNILDYQKKLKAHSTEISRTQTRERKQLAQDLHDGLGQDLVFAKMRIDSLKALAQKNEFQQELSAISETLSKAIQDTRMLTSSLSTPILKELGFENALAEWLDKYIEKEHGIKTTFEPCGDPIDVPETTQDNLYRITRELLINVVKHANAKNVQLSVMHSGTKLFIIVKDDGIGFEVPDNMSGDFTTGFGLFSIQEQLDTISGKMTIHSEKNQGCEVIIEVPLHAEVEE